MWLCSTTVRNPPKIRPVTSGTDGKPIGKADKLSIEVWTV